MKHYSKVSSPHSWIVVNYLLSYKHQQEKKKGMTKNGFWEEKGKSHRELGIDHKTSLGLERQIDADGKASIERVSGTAKEGKCHEYAEIIFCYSDLNLFMNKYTNKLYIIKKYPIISNLHHWICIRKAKEIRTKAQRLS